MTRALSRGSHGSKQTSAPLDAAESALLRAEAVIRLLDRLSPENAAAERERLRVALARGERAEPTFRYPPPRDLSEVRRGLDRLARSLSEGEALAREYADRALELELEAALVTARGSASFLALAARRFDPGRLYPPERVAELVAEWIDSPREAAAERVPSDDSAHPESLISVLRREIGARGLPVRVELHPALSAVAAAGDDVVKIRPGVLLSARQARRIAEHELVGHVLPRLSARAEALGLFRTGFRGSGDEEEGRALWLEERGRFLDGARRVELGLRHRAALSVRSGATLTEAVRTLLDAGAGLEPAVDLVLRALRGGGLAREIVYLPAYLAVTGAFARQPELERYFRRGRASLRGARLLARLEARPMAP